MKVLFISSLNYNKHYGLYGKLFTESFEKFSDYSLALTVEGIIPEKFFKIKQYPLNTVNFPKLHSFMSKCNDTPDWKQDAKRFARKAYTIYHMLKTSTDYDYIVWLDADCVLLKKLDVDFFDFLLPRDYQLVSCIQREGMHSETGIIAFNMNHPRIREFADKYIDVYNSGEIFKLKEKHDAFIFDFILRGLNVSIHNLNTSGTTKHPFNFCTLGKYIDHLKGNRKELGISPERKNLC